MRVVKNLQSLNSGLSLDEGCHSICGIVIQDYAETVFSRHDSKSAKHMPRSGLQRKLRDAEGGGVSISGALVKLGF